jgi:hypothetical protein
MITKSLGYGVVRSQGHELQASGRSLNRGEVVSHPIMCEDRLGNMCNLRENMANSAGE